MMVMLRNSITNAHSIPSKSLGEADKSRRYSYFSTTEQQENITFGPLFGAYPIEVQGNFLVWGDGDVYLFMVGEASFPTVTTGMDTGLEFSIQEEVDASQDEYRNALRGDFSKLGVSSEVAEQARELFVKYVAAKLLEEEIEVDPDIEEKIANMLILVAQKSGEISLVVG